jgi:hypothetical protein
VSEQSVFYYELDTDVVMSSSTIIVFEIKSVILLASVVRAHLVKPPDRHFLEFIFNSSTIKSSMIFVDWLVEDMNAATTEVQNVRLYFSYELE